MVIKGIHISIDLRFNHFCFIAFIYVLGSFLKFSLGRREETAHEEAIWAIDWYRGPEQAIEGSKLITGSLDDSVKVSTCTMNFPVIISEQLIFLVLLN